MQISAHGECKSARRVDLGWAGPELRSRGDLVRDEVELVNEVHVMLEAGVQVWFGPKRRHLFEVAVVLRSGRAGQGGRAGGGGEYQGRARSCGSEHRF